MFLARIECLITKNFVKNCWSKVYTNENVRMFSWESFSFCDGFSKRRLHTPPGRIIGGTLGHPLPRSQRSCHLPLGPSLFMMTALLSERVSTRASVLVFRRNNREEAFSADSAGHICIEKYTVTKMENVTVEYMCLQNYTSNCGWFWNTKNCTKQRYKYPHPHWMCSWWIEGQGSGPPDIEQSITFLHKLNPSLPPRTCANERRLPDYLVHLIRTN